MRSTIAVCVGSFAFVFLGLAGACGGAGRPGGSRRPEPGITPPPDVGAAWPAPACTDEAVPIHDGGDRGRGDVIASGGRLYMRGDDPTTIEVAWEWGGPSAVLARGPVGRTIESFAVDDRYVYWSISAPRHPLSRCLLALEGAVYRVPKAGGPVETVVGDAGDPDYLGIDRGRVFWRDEGLCPKDIKQPTPRFIKRYDPTSGTVATVVDDPGLSELVVGAGTLWVLASDAIVETDTDGGGRKVLGRTTAGRGLIVTKDRLFIAMNPDLDPDYVAEIPRAGGAPRAVLRPHRRVGELAADGDTLYVSDGGEVLATPLAGGPVEVVANDASFAGLAGERVLVWTGAQRQTLESVPRTQRISELLAWQQSRPSSIASDRDALYWVTFDAVWRRPFAGGRAVRIAKDLGFADRIALAGDKVVVADDGSDRHGPGRVGVVPITGGPVTWLATDLDTPLEIAATSTDAIYGDGRGTIWRVPLAGGAPTELAKGTGPFVATVITDGKTVYFARYAERTVYAVSLHGTAGKVTAVGEAIAPPMSLMLDDRDVVIATQFGEIQRVAATGGVPRTIARAAGVPGSLVRDATHVYWITNEAIERVPRAGGIKQRIAAGANGVLAVAGDDVFWSEGGTIRRAAKRPAGAVNQSTEPELGPLAVAGDKVYVGTRTAVRELDLATGEFPVILALHATPQWVGTDGATVFAFADDKLWAIDLADARKRRQDILAKMPRSTDREPAFDSHYTPPASTSPIGAVGRAILVGDAAVWTSGDHVYRLGKTGGAVQTVASGLAGLDWIASDPSGKVYVTARDGDRWAVYALGAPATPPVREATIDRAPRGLAVTANAFVVSTESEVLRLPRGGGAPEVLAANQRGAGPVAAVGRAVYWMTRDGIMVTDGTGCGAHRIARWPSDGGILPMSSLVATDAGVVFTDVAAGMLVTVR